MTTEAAIAYNPVHRYEKCLGLLAWVRVMLEPMAAANPRSPFDKVSITLPGDYPESARRLLAEIGKELDRK